MIGRQASAANMANSICRSSFVMSSGSVMLFLITVNSGGSGISVLLLAFAMFAFPVAFALHIVLFAYLVISRPRVITRRTLAVYITGDLINAAVSCLSSIAWQTTLTDQL